MEQEILKHPTLSVILADIEKDISKTLKIVKSCKTVAQLKGANNYCKLFEKKHDAIISKVIKTRAMGESYIQQCWWVKSRVKMLFGYALGMCVGRQIELRKIEINARINSRVRARQGKSSN